MTSESVIIFESVVWGQWPIRMNVIKDQELLKKKKNCLWLVFSYRYIMWDNNSLILGRPFAMITIKYEHIEWILLGAAKEQNSLILVKCKHIIKDGNEFNISVKTNRWL